ncbi:MAG: hypothetical protein ACOYBE_07175 [Blautia sp.]|jgi:spore germination protein KB
MRRIGSILLLLCISLPLCACSGVEPEKRSYPLIMAVDQKDGGFQVIYGMPNLPASTGQEKEGNSSDTQPVLSFYGPTLEAAREEYDRSQEKYLDMGHLQILVLGEGLLKEDKWKTLFEYLRRDPSVGEDIYLFTASDVGKVMEKNGTLSSSLGEYLVGIYENRPKSQMRKGVSLREAYGSMLEGKDLPDLPALVVSEDKISVV